ncbi:MAG: hypothetical protein KBT34_01625 [Prevotella sp.]|nr:hypothetical protein [Candidatus Prevotella equi]
MIRDIDTYSEHLFADLPAMQEAKLLPSVIDRILRVRDVYTHWRQFPSMLPQDIVNWNIEHCRQFGKEIKKSAAYEDIAVCKELMGRLNEESREWKQWFVNQQFMKLYETAMKAKDYKSAEKALADFAKYNKLDKDEPFKPDYDIKPEGIEATDDPRYAGIEPMERLREQIRFYNKKYKMEAIDADFEEVMEAARESGELREEAQDETVSQ